MTYSEKLRDPRWQNKRALILERDNFTCQDCGAKRAKLHVHHCLYRKEREPWEYENEVLRTLCEDCHDARHGFEKDCIAAFKILLAGKTRQELYSIHESLISGKAIITDETTEMIQRLLKSRS